MPVKFFSWSNEYFRYVYFIWTGISTLVFWTRASLLPAFRHRLVPLYRLLCRRTLMQWILVCTWVAMPFASPAVADSSELVISAKIQFAYAETLFNDKDFSTA